MTALLSAAPLAVLHAEDPALDQQARQQGVPVDELRAFAEVMERIRGAYIDEVDDRELLESAIRGMLYELDPHSSYLTPDQFDDLQVTTTGEFGGLGIEVTMEDGFVKVVTPVDDSPASKAGIHGMQYNFERDLGASGTRVHVICPGGIATPPRAPRGRPPAAMASRGARTPRPPGPQAAAPVLVTRRLIQLRGGCWEAGGVISIFFHLFPFSYLSFILICPSFSFFNMFQFSLFFIFIHIFMFYYINGPHSTFVQIDMVLSFNFVRDFPGNVFIKAPTIHPELARGARQLWDDFPGLYKDISWEVPDEN